MLVPAYPQIFTGDRQLNYKSAPGPKGLSGISSIFALGKMDPLVYWQEVHAEYGSTVRLALGPMDIWSFCSAEAIYEVLVTRHKVMRKGLGYFGLRKLLGEGLITTDKDHWSDQRSRLNPLFTIKSSESYSGAIHDACLEGISELNELASKEQPIDIGKVMTRFTMRVISKAAFGVDLTSQQDEVIEAFEFAFAFLADISSQPVRLPLFVPTSQNRKFAKSSEIIDRFVDGLINQSDHSPASQSMSAQIFSALRGIDRKLLRDEVLSLYFAGFETTARTMSFIMDLLPRHPKVLEKVRIEAKSFSTREDGVVGLADLPIAAEVVSEVLRIFPPVAMMARQNNEDCEICGYKIRRNSLIIVNPYLCQRSTTYWKAGSNFEPDFQQSIAQRAVHRGTYTPFGAGPRLCLGKNFALLELAIATSMIAGQFDWEPVDPTPASIEFHGTLRPAKPIMANLKRL